MGDGTFNIAKGKVNGFVDRVASNDPAASGLILVILKTTAADAVLKDFDTLAVLLAGTSVEADFTNYARKSLTDAVISAPTPDDGTDSQSADIPDQTWTSAGGTLDNTTAKAIICYAPDVAGADSTLVPLTYHDFVATTNGNDLLLQVAAAGFFAAS